VCLPAATPLRPDLNPWEPIVALLTRTQQILTEEGWTPGGSDGRHGPRSLTDAVAAAAFPAGQEDEDEAATRRFCGAWDEIARAAVEVLGVTPDQFQAAPNIERHHVVALVECAKLRLQLRTHPTTAPEGRWTGPDGQCS
jgi:hypothetical protein